MARSLPSFIKRAIKSGPIPKVRNWRLIAERAETGEQIEQRLTIAEQTMFFIESYLLVPEGVLQGKPMRLDLFQEVFIYALLDNPAKTSRAYLSMARKNGKTGLIAALLIAFLIGPPSANSNNAQLISGAMSRDQAALVYKLAEKMILMNNVLKGFLRTVSSHKMIVNLSRGLEYKAISAEASTAHGLSPKIAILDEIGQVVGPLSAFVEAVTTAQGAYDDAILIAISTSAASDADLFSIWCDDAERSDDPHTVCHVYAAEEDCELLDSQQWQNANPALGKFRSKSDLTQKLEQASRLPSMEASVRNLLLNQRVALERLWLAPGIWKANNRAPDWNVFKEHGVHVGLDLSQRNDLTCACIAARDADDAIHLFPFTFTPLNGLKERSRRDRVPYEDWVRDGVVIGVPGATVDYDWVASYLKLNLSEKEIEVHTIEFDRWRIKEFTAACERQGFEAFQFHEVGQGFQSMAPRVEAFEQALLQNRIRHGSHPALNLGAANAIVQQSPAGDRKLNKAKSSQKIDCLVAAVMAAYELIAQTNSYDDDVSWWIA